MALEVQAHRNQDSTTTSFIPRTRHPSFDPVMRRCTVRSTYLRRNLVMQHDTVYICLDRRFNRWDCMWQESVRSWTHAAFEIGPSRFPHAAALIDVFHYHGSLYTCDDGNHHYILPYSTSFSKHTKQATQRLPRLKKGLNSSKCIY